MPEPSQTLAYIVALGIAAAIPGPGITALVARAAGSGSRAAFAMLAGLIVGDLIYLSFAVFGLAVIANSFQSLLVAIRWFSIAYLLLLAWQFWHAGHHDLASGTMSRRGTASAALSGLTITLGNPKTIAFYLALLPVVIDLRQVDVTVWAGSLVPLTILVLLVVGGAFILAALSVRRWLSSARAQRRLHRGAALAMAGAAGAMVLRNA